MQSLSAVSEAYKKARARKKCKTSKTKCYEKDSLSYDLYGLCGMVCELCTITRITGWNE